MVAITAEMKIKLVGIIKAIEQAEAEKTELQTQIKEIYENAANNNLDVAAIKKLIALRKLPEEKRIKLNDTIESYMLAMGM